MSSVVFPCKFPLFCSSTSKPKPIFQIHPSSTSPSPYAVSSSLPQSVLAFWKWIKEEGVVSPYTCPVEPALVPEGLGLVATRDVNKDEFLLKIPRRLWVNTDTVASSEIGSICGGLKPWVAVCLFLAREKEMGSSSPWRFYLDVLPERTDSTIFWWAGSLEFS